MANKPCPMPLFNFRKRQRQALVSDPQTMSPQVSSPEPVPKSSDNFHSSDGYSDSFASRNQTGFQQSHKTIVNQVRSFPTASPKNNSNNHNSSISAYQRGSSKPQMSTSRNNSHDNFNQNNRLSNNAKETYPSTFSKESKNSFAISRTNNGNTFLGGNNQASVYSSTSTSRGRGYSFSNRGIETARTGLQKHSNTDADYADNLSNQTSSYAPSMKTTPGQLSYKGARHALMNTQSYPDKSHGPSPSGQLRVQSGTFQSDLGVQKSSQSSRDKTIPGSSYGNRPAPSYSHGSGNNSVVAATPRRLSAVETEMSETTLKPAPMALTSQKTDTTVRFFTCSISVLRTWSSAQLFDGLVMFEIYGKVISSSMPDKTGTGKEFVLQDDSSSIKCIFYEIDRELPVLTRGQIHRAVGTLDRKRGMLKVVSVRKAKKDEHQMYLMATENTMEEMQSLGLTLNVNEP